MKSRTEYLILHVRDRMGFVNIPYDVLEIVREVVAAAARTARPDPGQTPIPGSGAMRSSGNSVF